MRCPGLSPPRQPFSDFDLLSTEWNPGRQLAAAMILSSHRDQQPHHARQRTTRMLEAVSAEWKYKRGYSTFSDPSIPHSHPPSSHSSRFCHLEHSFIFSITYL